MTYKIYGEKKKGKHPSESLEMTTFFNKLRQEYPDTLALIAVHIRNEGKKTYQQISKEKLHGGFIKGASDIIIPGSPSFVCEMKSMNASSLISDEQKIYLNAVAVAGSFSCVAYGYEAAWEALEQWLNLQS